MNVSVVIPLFNEEESIKELSTWIVEVMKKNKFSQRVGIIANIVRSGLSFIHRVSPETIVGLV